MKSDGSYLSALDIPYFRAIDFERGHFEEMDKAIGPRRAT
jgi:hypothetical protein